MHPTVTKLLTCILVLQGLILAALWKGGAAVYADLPNTVPQIQETTDQMKALNAKADQLLDLLENGHLQVQVKGADDAKAVK